MRQKIDAKAEPWYTAWQELQGESDAKLTWTPHPVADWDANKNAYMGGDAVAAYSHALQWALTGKQENADKAIEILNAWSSTLQTIHGTTKQDMVVCGWNGNKLANAAELLRYYTPPGGKPSGWKDEDIQRFTTMLGKMTDVMKNFNPRFNGNWDAAMMNSLMCIAVFTDDQDLFKRATDHFAGKDQVPDSPSTPDSPSPDKGHLTSYFLLTGQCQESGRDQGHVQMGIGNYIAICEVASKQGIDLFSAADNRLLLGIEYTAKYMLGNDDVPFAPSPIQKWMAISPADRGLYSPIWEAAYQHYACDKGLPMPYTKQIVEGTSVLDLGRKTPGNYRPEGSSPNTGICWGTLTMYRGPSESQVAPK